MNPLLCAYVKMVFSQFHSSKLRNETGKINQKYERHTIRLERFDLHESRGKFYYSTEFHCTRFTLCGERGICAISLPLACEMEKFFPPTARGSSSTNGNYSVDGIHLDSCK